MRILSYILVASGMLMGSSSAMAQVAPTAAPAMQAATVATQQPAAISATGTTATVASADDSNTIVCKRMDPTTGTRLGARQICKTNAQWAAMYREVHHDISTYQETHSKLGIAGTGGTLTQY
jgi:hypothetical protein